MKKLFFSTLLVLMATLSFGQKQLPKGEGSFVYDSYKPLSSKPVTVHYYIPTKGDITKMPILFSMHGAGRNGKGALVNWIDFAQRDGIIVIAPEFSKEYYKENDYQFGGVKTSVRSDKIRPVEEWTYSIIEPLFDYIKAATKNRSATYDMQGHSAGSQWTHRFLLATPNARIGRAVASNAGSYTFPYIDGIEADGEFVGWAFSPKGTPMATEEHLKSWFSKKITIHAGNRDIDTQAKDLPKSAAAFAQGSQRFERAQNFYKVCKEMAEAKGWEFNWNFVEVDRVAHAGRSMVYGKRKKGSDGKWIFSIDNISQTGAYYILYGNK